MTQYKFTMNSQSLIGNLTWNANGTLGSLNITDPFNNANAQNCAYAYDDLARIQTYNCGSAWAQTFSYDAFGSISKSGSISFQPTYSSSTNRMVSLPGFTPSYDANGNVLNDSFQQYTWDAVGRPVTIGSMALTYDAVGRMVEQNNNGSYTEIVYSPAGGKLALMNGQTLQKAFVPLSAGAVAVYTAGGLSYYRHPDWLGSSRFASTPSRTMYFDVAYAPFGEPYAQSGTSDLSFTGQNQDTTGGLYDFKYREYSIQGRWPSPDAAGLQAADSTDPQTFNRYAYVSNRPLNFVDPLGLKMWPWNTGGGGGGFSWAWLYAAFGGGGGGFGGFTLDGVATPSALVQGLLASGAAIQCPNNQCTGTVTNLTTGKAQGTFFTCGSSACGYLTPQEMATYNSECGTDFCSSSEYSQWAIQQNPDAAQSQVDTLNARLGTHYTLADAAFLQGGNLNFRVTDDSPLQGICGGSGRCSGELDGVHFVGTDAQYSYVHLDTGNPFSGSLADFFGHVFVDGLLGNVAYNIIPRP